MIRLSYLYASVFSGLLGGIGMLVAPLWVCAPLSLGVVIFLIWNATNAREAVLLGTVFGVITSGAGLLALWEIVPPLQSEAVLPTLLSALFLWVTPTIALGLTSTPVAYGLFLTRDNTFAPAIAVALWILNEVLRMWAWTVITYGKGAVMEPHLSIAGLGYALADSTLTLPFAQYGGFFALTFLTGVLAVACATLLRSFKQHAPQDKTSAVVTVCVSMVLIVLPFLHPPHAVSRTNTSLTIALLHLDFPNNTPVNSTSLLTASTSPDVVVFPEGKQISQLPQEIKDRYLSWKRNNPELVTIRSDLTTNAQGEKRHSILYESASGNVLTQQDKHFMMPQGEYIPLLYALVFRHIPNIAIPHVDTTQTIVHGTSLTTLPFRGYTIGSLLCSEVFSPFLYKELVQNHGATLLINLGDPMWFRGSRLLYRKTIQVAKVHAVEHHAYVLFAQNSAPSFVINPEGLLIDESPWDTQGVLMARIGN